MRWHCALRERRPHRNRLPSIHHGRNASRGTIAHNGLRYFNLASAAVGVDVVEEVLTCLTVAIRAVGDTECVDTILVQEATLQQAPTSVAIEPVEGRSVTVVA